MIGRGQITSVLKYQAVGFDMDHTLIRYRLRHFAEHVYDATAIFLANHKDYPQEVFPGEGADAAATFQFFFRAVYDHATGNLLKMASNGLIMRAYHGFRRLGRAEIIAQYGRNPQVEGYHILAHRDAAFTNLHEFYGAAVVPLLARVVQLKSTGAFAALNAKGFPELMRDVWEANAFNFGAVDVERFRRHEYSGYFFPKFLSNPRQYVNPVSAEILARLRRLRQRGIAVFLASNSYFEVAEVLLRETIGADWHEYFDFAVFDCRKPAFFAASDAPPPFTDLQGRPVPDLRQWMERAKGGAEKVLLGGHADVLSQHFSQQAAADYKVLFFGDTIVSDCVYAFDKEKEYNWDCVLIFEELQEIENGLGGGEYPEYWKSWGSALQDKNIYSGVNATVVFDFADNVAHRAFSSLGSKECLCLLSVEDSTAAEEKGPREACALSRRSSNFSQRSGVFGGSDRGSPPPRGAKA